MEESALVLKDILESMLRPSTVRSVCLENISPFKARMSALLVRQTLDPPHLATAM